MPIIYYDIEGRPVGDWKTAKKLIEPKIYEMDGKKQKGYSFGQQKLVEPITLKDLQEFFGVDDEGNEELTARTFQRLIQRGCIEATRIGRMTFLTEQQMDDWFERHTYRSSEGYKLACPHCQKLPHNQPDILKKEREERKKRFESNFPSAAPNRFEEINNYDVVDEMRDAKEEKKPVKSKRN